MPTAQQIKLADPVQLVLGAKGRMVWSVDPSTSVYEALRLMSEKEIGALAVLSGGRLEGVISERDYARKVILKGRSSHETQVREIMASPPITVTPDDSIDDCMRIMTEQRVRHLPVVKDGALAGMVSIGDLVKWIITSQEETIRQLHSYIHGDYPQ